MIQANTPGVGVFLKEGPYAGLLGIRIYDFLSPWAAYPNSAVIYPKLQTKSVLGRPVLVNQGCVGGELPDLSRWVGGTCLKMT